MSDEDEDSSLADFWWLNYKFLNVRHCSKSLLNYENLAVGFDGKPDEMPFPYNYNNSWYTKPVPPPPLPPGCTNDYDIRREFGDYNNCEQWYNLNYPYRLPRYGYSDNSTYSSYDWAIPQRHPYDRQNRNWFNDNHRWNNNSKIANSRNVSRNNSTINTTNLENNKEISTNNKISNKNVLDKISNVSDNSDMEIDPDVEPLPILNNDKEISVPSKTTADDASLNICLDKSSINVVTNKSFLTSVIVEKNKTEKETATNKKVPDSNISIDKTHVSISTNIKINLLPAKQNSCSAKVLERRKSSLAEGNVAKRKLSMSDEALNKEMANNNVTVGRNDSVSYEKPVSNTDIKNKNDKSSISKHKLICKRRNTVNPELEVEKVVHNSKKKPIAESSSKPTEENNKTKKMSMSDEALNKEMANNNVTVGRNDGVSYEKPVSNTDIKNKNDKSSISKHKLISKRRYSVNPELKVEKVVDNSKKKPIAESSSKSTEENNKTKKKFTMSDKAINKAVDNNVAVKHLKATVSYKKPVGPPVVCNSKIKNKDDKSPIYKNKLISKRRYTIDPELELEARHSSKIDDAVKKVVHNSKRKPIVSRRKSEAVDLYRKAYLENEKNENLSSSSSNAKSKTNGMEHESRKSKFEKSINRKQESNSGDSIFVHAYSSNIRDSKLDPEQKIQKIQPVINRRKSIAIPRELREEPRPVRRVRSKSIDVNEFYNTRITRSKSREYGLDYNFSLFQTEGFVKIPQCLNVNVNRSKSDVNSDYSTPLSNVEKPEQYSNVFSKFMNQSKFTETITNPPENNNHKNTKITLPQIIPPPKTTPPRATPPRATPPIATPPKATPPRATPPPKITPPLKTTTPKTSSVSNKNKRGRSRSLIRKIRELFGSDSSDLEDPTWSKNVSKKESENDLIKRKRKKMKQRENQIKKIEKKEAAQWDAALRRETGLCSPTTSIRDPKKPKYKSKLPLDKPLKSVNRIPASATLSVIDKNVQKVSASTPNVPISIRVVLPEKAVTEIISENIFQLVDNFNTTPPCLQTAEIRTTPTDSDLHDFSDVLITNEILQAVPEVIKDGPGLIKMTNLTDQVKGLYSPPRETIEISDSDSSDCELTDVIVYDTFCLDQPRAEEALMKTETIYFDPLRVETIVDIVSTSLEETIEEQQIQTELIVKEQCLEKGEEDATSKFFSMINVNNTVKLEDRMFLLHSYEQFLQDEQRLGKENSATVQVQATSFLQTENSSDFSTASETSVQQETHSSIATAPRVISEMQPSSHHFSTPVEISVPELADTPIATAPRLISEVQPSSHSVQVSVLPLERGAVTNSSTTGHHFSSVIGNLSECQTPIQSSTVSEQEEEVPAPLNMAQLQTLKIFLQTHLDARNQLSAVPIETHFTEEYREACQDLEKLFRQFLTGVPTAPSEAQKSVSEASSNEELPNVTDINSREAFIEQAQTTRKLPSISVDQWNPQEAARKSPQIAEAQLTRDSSIICNKELSKEIQTQATLASIEQLRKIRKKHISPSRVEPITSSKEISNERFQRGAGMPDFGSNLLSTPAVEEKVVDSNPIQPSLGISNVANSVISNEESHSNSQISTNSKTFENTGQRYVLAKTVHIPACSQECLVLSQTEAHSSNLISTTNSSQRQHREKEVDVLQFSKMFLQKMLTMERAGFFAKNYLNNGSFNLDIITRELRTSVQSAQDIMYKNISIDFYNFLKEQNATYFDFKNFYKAVQYLTKRFYGHTMVLLQINHFLWNVVSMWEVCETEFLTNFYKQVMSLNGNENNQIPSSPMSVSISHQKTFQQNNEHVTSTTNLANSGSPTAKYFTEAQKIKFFDQCKAYKTLHDNLKKNIELKLLSSTSPPKARVCHPDINVREEHAIIRLQQVVPSEKPLGGPKRERRTSTKNKRKLSTNEELPVMQPSVNLQLNGHQPSSVNPAVNVNDQQPSVNLSNQPRQQSNAIFRIQQPPPLSHLQQLPGPRPSISFVNNPNGQQSLPISLRQHQQLPEPRPINFLNNPKEQQPLLVNLSQNQQLSGPRPSINILNNPNGQQPLLVNLSQNRQLSGPRPSINILNNPNGQQPLLVHLSHHQQLPGPRPLINIPNNPNRQQPLPINLSHHQQLPGPRPLINIPNNPNGQQPLPINLSHHQKLPGQRPPINFLNNPNGQQLTTHQPRVKRIGTPLENIAKIQPETALYVHKKRRMMSTTPVMNNTELNVENPQNIPIQKKQKAQKNVASTVKKLRSVRPKKTEPAAQLEPPKLQNLRVRLVDFSASNRKNVSSHETPLSVEVQVIQTPVNNTTQSNTSAPIQVSNLDMPSLDNEIQCTTSVPSKQAENVVQSESDTTLLKELLGKKTNQTSIEVFVNSEKTVDADFEDVNFNERNESHLFNFNTNEVTTNVLPPKSSLDSGFSSPPLKMEIYEQSSHNRLCICSKMAYMACVCRIAIYCSTACQQEDWPNHKDACFRARPTS